MKNGGNEKSLGTLHEDKPLDARSIVAKTDVISAMEAIEGKDASLIEVIDAITKDVENGSVFSCVIRLAK